MRRYLATVVSAALIGNAPGGVSPAHAEDAPRTLVVIPMGNPDPAAIELVTHSLRERLRLNVRVLAGHDMPRAAWYAPRKRWRADEILDHLDDIDVGEAWRVTALTEKPISTTKGKVYDWGIAGLGRLDGKSSVLSAYYFRRFKKKAPERYRRYVENLVLHEVGHTLGLDHCPLDRCIMADAKGNAIRAARVSVNEFCPRCTRLLSGHVEFRKHDVVWTPKERKTLAALDP